MARPQRVTATGSGSGVTHSVPYMTNWRAGESSIGIGLTTSGSTTGCKLQHTFADPALDMDPDQWVWFDHPDPGDATAHPPNGALGFNGTLKRTGSYDFPITGIRMELDANGTDTWTLHIVPSTS